MYHLLWLQKVKLVDAGFIWTEPHSKRLKVKLTIQAEVFNGTILQQGFVVEFVVENHMCLECNRANANPNTWTACAQVGLLVIKCDVRSNKEREAVPATSLLALASEVDVGDNSPTRQVSVTGLLTLPARGFSHCRVYTASTRI